jgi:hypothetical protein
MLKIIGERNVLKWPLAEPGWITLWSIPRGCYMCIYYLLKLIQVAKNHFAFATALYGISHLKLL